MNVLLSGFLTDSMTVAASTDLFDFTIVDSDPAEGYGIKYEGSFLEKSQSGCVQNFCHFVCLHHFWA